PRYEHGRLGGATREERRGEEAPVEILGAAEDGEGEKVAERREAGEVIRFGWLAAEAEEGSEEIEPEEPAGGVEEEGVHAGGEQDVVESAEAEPLGEAG